MKAFITTTVAAAFLGAMSLSGVVSAPAQAQATATCVAQSSSGAWGQWTHYDPNYACQQALIQCAVRTPVWDRCYVTRWWWN